MDQVVGAVERWQDVRAFSLDDVQATGEADTSGVAPGEGDVLREAVDRLNAAVRAGGVGEPEGAVAKAAADLQDALRGRGPDERGPQCGWEAR